MNEQEKSKRVLPRPQSLALVAISSQDLFRGTRELLIRHGQEIYRLRQTQAGKLILTK